jgi:hypothetical protein
MYPKRIGNRVGGGFVESFRGRTVPAPFGKFGCCNSVTDSRSKCAFAHSQSDADSRKGYIAVNMDGTCI